MGTTGRNDPCPCGSGKKYKKCHWAEVQESTPNVVSASMAEPAYPYLKNHNLTELLTTFAGLTVTPENHGKYFRLERLLIHSVLADSDQMAVPQSLSLKTFLDKEFESEPMEDICTNTFTDQVSFVGGDFLVFPGITENGVEILTSQLHAIFHWPENNIPEGFKTAVYSVSLLGLGLSDLIAKRLQYYRYMVSEPDENTIFVPDQDRLEQLKASVIISKANMDELIARYHLAPTAIQSFLLDPNEISSRTLYLDESPAADRPLILSGENYIVHSPATIVPAITRLIWRMAEGKDFEEKVYSAYHSSVWNNAQARLQTFGYRPVMVEGINDDLGQYVNVYRFDRDKIAYIRYMGDFGKKNTSFIPDRTEEHIAVLEKHVKYGSYKKIVVVIVCGIGRALYGMMKPIAGIESISIPVFDLEVLWRLNKGSALDIWKFSLARKKLMAYASDYMVMTEFLDLYKLFDGSAQSFYIDGDAPNMVPVLEPGYAFDWLIKAKSKADQHAVVYNRGDREVTVPVERKEGSSPIYVHLPDASEGVLRFAVEGYSQPIWVKPEPQPNGEGSDLRSLYFQTTDAIAYWIWQITADVSPYIATLGSDPIVVSFSFVPLDKFENMDRDFTRQPNLADRFETSITDDGFHIKIPSELIAYLYGADNEGERVLVAQMIKGFNLNLAAKGQPLIGQDKNDEILVQRAPLGMKKKFFILDSADNLLLDPRNLKAPRYIQDYDVSVVLDSIVPGLGAACPPVGEIASIEKRNELANQITTKVLMAMLIAKLNELENEKLLQVLIGMNESLIRKREELRVNTPTRIACYVSQDDQVESLMTSLGDVNRSTIAIRCLIEQIAAEPSAGKKEPSVTDVDEVIAIMDQIISWGSTSDHIHFGLFDVKMGILPTGRIGSEKTMINSVLDPYYHSKTQENVKDAIETFEQVFPQNQNIVGSDIPQKLDAAFVSDYGISMTRIADFIDGLAQIGFLQNTDYAVCPLAELRDEINKYVDPFSEEDFQIALNYIALQDRVKLINIDKKAGYEFIDIMPWRFNRMLSLMRKPVVITGKPGAAERNAYWGARQVLASRIYLAEQVQSGRIRVPKEKIEIAKAIGAFAGKRGALLVENIVKAIDPAGLIIDTDLFIGPSFEFKNDIDIGDLDVLVIDPEAKVLYSLESKSMLESRNIKEMIEEVSKLFGSESELGLIGKHMRRDKWLRENIDQVSKKYKIDLSGFEIKSLFITDEDMLTPYLRKMSLPLPFLNRYNLNEQGMLAIREAVK
jgi:hypothetical protein